MKRLLLTFFSANPGMVKVIRAIWKYSTQMWKARCNKIHNAGPDKQSVSRKETINLIQQELERTKYFGDFEIRQLQSNIKKSMGNSPTTALQTWLQMIRAVKESKLMLEKDTLITKTRMQSIKRFLCRPDHA